MKYLEPLQIEAMSDAALTNYELSCEWGKAAKAAEEYCIDEYGFIPRRSAVLLARNLAKIRWFAIVEATRKAMGEPQQ